MAINPRHVRTWQARAALLIALPDVCPDAVRELIDTARNSRGATAAAVVRQWQRTHGLDRSWLVGPLGSILNWAVTLGADALVNPALWAAQLWQVQEFCDIDAEKLTIAAEWKNPTPPTRGSLDRQEWSRTLGAWAETVVPRQPIAADPTGQSREKFLAWAARHYDSRAADLKRRGWSTYRESQYLEQHAAWTLRRYVLLVPPALILPGQVAHVKKSITRFARLVDLGAPRRTRSPRRSVHRVSRRRQSSSP